MILQKRLPKMVCLGLCVVLVLQLAGCGTIIYPERRGQAHGQIDPGIAVLDALGLLLFIIPGVIAFAVDFSTGAIYLQPGQKPKTLSVEKVAVIQVSPAELHESTICRIVEENTGCSEISSLRGAKVVTLNGVEEIGKKIEEAEKSGYRVN